MHSQKMMRSNWFTEDKMNIILKIHNYLEDIPEIGKVQSLGTLLKLGKTLNKGEELDGFKLAILYNKLPLEYKEIILSPFINIKKSKYKN